uniref:N-terminal extension of GAT domain-containing protein n=1 Tax=Ditylenchus dipsaci TaxID=166011 RepID=A0A915E501_9BILA
MMLPNSFQLLAHKLLSPDQVETLQTLQLTVLITVSDQRFFPGPRPAGKTSSSRVAVEVGKFKFLNNFIRLLSPKYHESLRHLEKNAKSTNCSESRTSSTRTPTQPPNAHYSFVQHKSPPKLATFEDEQKASCCGIAEEQQARDLQAANRMIKSMVRAEDPEGGEVSQEKGDAGVSGCETLQTLQVLDQLVRQAGSRVAVEVGKFKFLNNSSSASSPNIRSEHTLKLLEQGY